MGVHLRAKYKVIIANNFKKKDDKRTKIFQAL